MRDDQHPASRDPYAAPSLPQACGAVGRFDRGRVERMAAHFAGRLNVAHEGPSALLMLDRDPVRWGRGDRRGAAWPESLLPPAGRVRSREDAANGGLCGLAVEGGRVAVHASVSGIGPLYYMSDGPAVYFATRIDPLVQAAPGKLNVDWEAWASILTLNLAVGERTPFAEIRRLGPSGVVTAGPTGTEISADRWSWAEQEANLSLEAGIPGVAEAMRGAIERLPRAPVALPLTGGWDSRVLLCLLRDDPDRRPRAVTTSRELGTWQEEDLATAVARTAGVRHETIDPEAHLWWDDVRRQALLTDYQFVARPWAVSLARGTVDWTERPVLDGLALDTFSQAGGRLIPEEAIFAATAHEAGAALWRQLRSVYARRPLTPYRPALRRALWASCEDQVTDAVAALGDAPSRALLGLYVTRTRRGVALLPTAVLGATLPMVTLYTDDAVARACLAIDPLAKVGVGIHPALMRALDPELATLPSTNDGLPPWPRVRPLRQRTPQALRALRGALERGSLAPLLQPAAWELFRSGRTPNGALRVVLFHLWEERYRDRLATVDPVAGLGLPERLRDAPTVSL